MKVNRDFADVTVKLWLSAFQTSDVLRTCTDQLLVEYGITSEQYDVLATAKHLSDRVKISDIATWLRRSPNSVSMLVDRMVKAGLVKRLRDRGDRRVVYVILTSKGQNILELSSPGIWEFIKEILSPLSYEDRRTFLSLFEMINRKALEHLNPGRDIEGIVRDRAERHAELMKRVPAYTLTASPQSKRQVAKRKKAS